MAGIEDKIEGGLSSLLGKDVDIPSWLTPVMTGLVGAIGGKALGKATGGSGGLGAVLGGLLGGAAGGRGLQDILGKFTGAGAGDQANSWVSTGENQPIDAATTATHRPNERPSSRLLPAATKSTASAASTKPHSQCLSPRTPAETLESHAASAQRLTAQMTLNPAATNIMVAAYVSQPLRVVVMQLRPPLTLRTDSRGG